MGKARLDLAGVLRGQTDFRLKQISQSLFNPKIRGWDEITSLPKGLRENLLDNIPWVFLKLKELQISEKDGSQKALLELEDGNLIEAVLMGNARGGYTVCLSSQAGCPVGCAFCSTGQMGFARNLTSNEIIDQFRFWLYRNDKINNIVIMGMGEPFLNYENVRDAVRSIIKYSEIGPNHIVVSSVGIIDKLEQVLSDESWPKARLAISLHSAIDSTRKKIVPVHNETFFADLIGWSKKYLEKFDARNSHLSFEYILLESINDSQDEAQALVSFLKEIGDRDRIKVNLIQYNQTLGSFSPSKRIFDFQNTIKNAGIFCAIRKSYGSDISAACGQLAGKI
ncbi:MAG: 23S rRNA (adenine(2503)-C(2))-methyltransferase RlmN [bacterium]